MNAPSSSLFWKCPKCATLRPTNPAQPFGVGQKIGLFCWTCGKNTRHEAVREQPTNGR